MLDRLQPTLPMLAANLASIAPVLITYRADLEQLLVLLPWPPRCCRPWTFLTPTTQASAQVPTVSTPPR